MLVGALADGVVLKEAKDPELTEDARSPCVVEPELEAAVKVNLHSATTLTSHHHLRVPPRADPRTEGPDDRVEHQHAIERVEPSIALTARVVEDASVASQSLELKQNGDRIAVRGE